MTGCSEPFDEFSSTLQGMWRFSKLNRYFVPMSKLPPLGPDPRKDFAGKPPACAPDFSVPRAERIMGRWQSMPSLRKQLPVESLRRIECAVSAADKEATSPREMAVPHSRENFVCHGCTPMKPHLVRGTSFLRALPKHDGGGGKDNGGLHIPCTCCERRPPKPWLEKRSTAWRAATAPSGGDTNLDFNGPVGSWNYG